MSVDILNCDALFGLDMLPSGYARTCITSPPYFGLRDYGHDGQIGAEKTPDAYIVRLVEVFREVRRVLADDGMLWLNIGDSYAGSWGARGRGSETNAARPDLERKHGTAAPGRNGFPGAGVKPKDLIGIPWMLAFALRADGWYLRQDIIWHKPNPMPESVTDRCTKAHEYLFLLSKSERYFFDHAAIKEPAIGQASGGEMRQKRDVWTVAIRPYKGAHFATFPPALIEPCILAGSRPGDIVLDPFAGSGTTGEVAKRLGRRAVLIELNSEYIPLIEARVNGCHKDKAESLNEAA